MIKDNELLTIIVRMPEIKQSIGNRSIPWQDPEAIEKLFFERIALELKQDLQREISLHVKKSEHLADIARNFTFTETGLPPVYIIDLTEKEPNIFFELGVFWSMKNSIIVLVSQNIIDLKFNAPGINVIPYSKDPAVLEQAIASVITTIKNSVVRTRYKIDSNIVKDNDNLNEKYDTEVSPSKLILLGDKPEISMQSQKNLWQSSGNWNRNAHDRQASQDGLMPTQAALDHASSAKDPDQRMLLYQMVLHLNPTFLDAYLSLAREQRKQSRYDEALATFQQAIALFPTDANLYREQGLTYSKSGQLEKAIVSFRNALAMNNRDEKSWSVLGGLLRRIGTRSASYDWEALFDARDSYQKAIDLNDRNTYAQGNLARLDLILSKVDDKRFSLFKDEIDTLELLCRLDLKKDSKDYWTWLDLAECYLLSGKVDECYNLYAKAIELIPLEYRKSEISSVASALEHLVLIDIMLNDGVKGALQILLEDMNLLISGKISIANLRSICIHR